MRDSKLLELLATFKSYEWKSCRRYLASEMDESAEVIYLYDYIMKYRKDLAHKKLRIDFANQYLFKNKTMKNFQNVMSRLYGYLLDYIAVSHMKSDDRELRLHTLMSLNNRGLYRRALDTHDQYITLINSTSLDIWNTWFSLRATHAIRYSDNPVKLREPRESIDTLFNAWQKTISEMGQYYMLDTMYSNRLWKLGYDDQIKLLKRQSETCLSETTIAKLIRNVRSLFEDKHEYAYVQLFKNLKNDHDNMGDEIGSIVILYLIQYQLSEIKQGRGSLLELGELFDKGLKRRWLFDNNHISDVRFSMMVHTACLNNQIAKARELIGDWSFALSTESRDDIVALSRATVLFYDHSYSESIELLNAQPFKKFRDRNAARILLLMNYFLYYPENAEFMTTQISNYKSFLKRKEELSSESHFQGALNFVEILTSLVKKEDVTVIKDRAKGMNSLVRRTWLLRYLEQKEVMNK